MSKSHLDRKRNASWKHNWNRAPHYITRWMKTRQVKCEELYHCQNVLHINIAYLSNNFSSKFCIITFRYTDPAPTTSCSSHSHQKRFRKEHSCVFVGAFGLVAPDHPPPTPSNFSRLVPLAWLGYPASSAARVVLKLDAWRSPFLKNTAVWYRTRVTVLWVYIFHLSRVLDSEISKRSLPLHEEPFQRHLERLLLEDCWIHWRATTFWG